MTNPTPTPPAVPAGQPTEPAKPPVPAPPPKAAASTTPPAGDPPKPDEPLGENGLKALQAERKAREDLEKRLSALAPLEKIAAALGGGDPDKGKSEMEQITERLAKHEEQLAEANQARWRAEVANAKHLTPEQAQELRGSTAEELSAHADRLLTLFPTAPGTPAAPKPDPSQGSRGPVSIDSRIVEAESKGDTRTSIALKSQQLLTKK